MAQNQILPLGSGLGAIKAPSLQGDANEAAFRKDASSGGILGKLLGMYPPQSEAIDARKAAQARISDILGGIMASGDINVAPSGEVYGRSPERTREAAMNRLASFFRGGGLLRPDDQQGQSIIADTIFGGDQIDILSQDPSAGGIISERMPLTGDGGFLGDDKGQGLSSGTYINPNEAEIERQERGEFANTTPEITSVADDLAAMAGAEAREADETSPMTLMAEAEAQEGDEASKQAGTQGVARGDTTTRDGESRIGSGSIDLMKSALDSYNSAIGRAPSGAKSMQEYKDDFSKATGIDISGDPDNKAALTAFGLALMQNKAGKGFNVGKMLSEVGAAGEKALPLMEKARQEARAGQLAAGQYALGESKAADAARQKFLVDQSNYLQTRQDKILDYMQTRRDTLTDNAEKQAFDREKLAVEYGFKNAKARNEAFQEALKQQREGKKVESQYNRSPQYTQQKIRIGFTDNGSREIYANPRQDAAEIANSYVKLQRSQEAMGRLDALLAEIEESGMPAANILLDRAKNILIAGGVADPDTFFEGKLKGVSAEDQANAILNVLIMENKRFATQETGNGISNQDRQDLATAFGKIDILGNPRAARIKLAELRTIFNAPLASIEQELSDFYELKDMYRDENIYNQTISRVDEILSASPFNKIPNKPGDDGVIRFGQGEY